jgi:hypothetical protein
MFLKKCDDAGFEMGASAFMIYHWFSNPGFTLIEKILGPIPDYLQLLLSSVYIYSCVTKNYIDETYTYVNGAKLLQASVLPYVILTTFMKGDRHDMFTSWFGLWKFAFNAIDGSVYMNDRFHWIEALILGFEETF